MCEARPFRTSVDEFKGLRPEQVLLLVLVKQRSAVKWLKKAICTEGGITTPVCGFCLNCRMIDEAFEGGQEEK